MDEYYYAKIAYNAYCAKRNWVSVRGEQLPKFEDQSPELKDAWEEAAGAVLTAKPKE